jgi:predicted helicase
VQKVGERHYWEDWAKSIADIAQRQIERITQMVADGKVAEKFASFLAEMQASIDSSITKERAIEMLAQHSITAPVFDALFADYAFAKNNAVSVAMDIMLDMIGQDTETEAEKQELKGFYDSVRRRAEGIDNAAGRQQVIIELYNSFFKAAFPKMADQLGIVYTLLRL